MAIHVMEIEIYGIDFVVPEIREIFEENPLWKADSCCMGSPKAQERKEVLCDGRDSEKKQSSGYCGVE